MKKLAAAGFAALLLAACQTGPMMQAAPDGPSVVMAAPTDAIKASIQQNVGQRGYNVVESTDTRFVLQRSADPRLVQAAVGEVDDPNPQVRLTYTFVPEEAGTRVVITPAIVTNAGRMNQRVIPTPTHQDAARLEAELQQIRAQAERPRTAQR